MTYNDYVTATCLLFHVSDFVERFKKSFQPVASLETTLKTFVLGKNC